MTPISVFTRIPARCHLSDKRFWDGATREQVRAHFAGYLRRSNGWNYGRFEGCLLIDEASLKSIVACREPRPFDKSSPVRGQQKAFDAYVEMVYGRYSNTIKYGWAYPSFMRVELLSLWDLYLRMGYKSMSKLCPIVAEGLIPVYEGGNGKACDEEGNEHPRPSGRGKGVRVWP